MDKKWLARWSEDKSYGREFWGRGTACAKAWRHRGSRAATPESSVAVSTFFLFEHWCFQCGPGTSHGRWDGLTRSTVGYLVHESHLLFVLLLFELVRRGSISVKCSCVFKAFLPDTCHSLLPPPVLKKVGFLGSWKCAASWLWGWLERCIILGKTHQTLLSKSVYISYTSIKKRALRGEKEWASGSEPLAGHNVSFEFSNFYSYCIFTLPSIYGGDTDFPFVVVV